MQVTIAAFALFATMPLGGKTISICKDVARRNIQNGSLCSNAGGTPQGKED